MRGSYELHPGRGVQLRAHGRRGTLPPAYLQDLALPRRLRLRPNRSTASDNRGTAQARQPGIGRRQDMRPSHPAAPDLAAPATPRRAVAAGTCQTASLSTPSPVAAPARRVQHEERWWWAGDQKDLCVSLEDDTEAPADDGQALVGGNIRRGLLYTKPSGEGRPCLVKLLPIGRGDTQLAAQVVKETKRWMMHCAGASEAHVLRRTVATTALALPARTSNLSRSVRSLPRPLAHQITSQWPLSAAAATWAGQLLAGVAALHAEGIAHFCIAPATLNVNASGDIIVGDFLGKVKALRLLASGWKGPPDEAWAAWYPAEVQQRVSDGGYEMGCEQAVCRGGEEAPQTCGTVASCNVEGFRVDAWQVGVSIFYLLTGEHLFGDCRHDLQQVCANILADRQVNQPLLGSLPLFADFISRLTDRRPEQRLLPTKAARHPALWGFAEATRFVAPLLQRAAEVINEGERPSQMAPPQSSQHPLPWDRLRLLPALSVLGPATQPASSSGSSSGGAGLPAGSPAPELLRHLCHEAVSADCVSPSLLASPVPHLLPSAVPLPAVTASEAAAAAFLARLGRAIPTAASPATGQSSAVPTVAETVEPLLVAPASSTSLGTAPAPVLFTLPAATGSRTAVATGGAAPAEACDARQPSVPTTPWTTRSVLASRWPGCDAQLGGGARSTAPAASPAEVAATSALPAHSSAAWRPGEATTAGRQSPASAVLRLWSSQHTGSSRPVAATTRPSPVGAGVVGSAWQTV